MAVYPKSSPDIPIVNHSFTASLPIYDSNQADVQISHGDILNWVLRFSVNNADQNLQSLGITFTNIINKATALPLTLNLTPADFQNFSIDLSAQNGVAQYMISGPQNQLLDEITFTVTPISSSENIPMLGSLRVYFTESLLFDSFTGKIDNRVISANDSNVSIDIEYPTGIQDAVVVNQAILKLTLVNPIGFRAIFTGTIVATNHLTNQTVTLDISQANNNSINLDHAIDPNTPDTTIVEINDPAIAQMVNIAPDAIIIQNSQFQISSDPNELGFISHDNHLYGWYEMKVPFVFTFNSTQMTPKSPVKIEVSEDNQKNIRDNAVDADLVMHYVNKLPIGTKVELFFSGSNDPTILFDPTYADNFGFSNQYIIAAPANGEVADSMSFHLTHEQLLIFANHPTVYFGMRYTLTESSGPVTIYSDEYIKIIAHLSIKFKIDNK